MHVGLNRFFVVVVMHSETETELVTIQERVKSAELWDPTFFALATDE